MKAKTARQRQEEYRKRQAKQGFKTLTLSAHIEAHSVIKTLARISKEEDFKNTDELIKKLRAAYAPKKRLYLPFFTKKRAK